MSSRPEHSGRQRFLTVAVLIVVVSCGAERKSDDAADDTTVTQSETRVELPTGEQLTVQPFATSDRFPLQFRTLLPAGTVARTEADTAGNLVAIQFTDDRNVTVSADAYVHVYVYAPGTIAHNARNAVQALLLSRGRPGTPNEERPPEGPRMLPPQPWALMQEDYEFQGPDSRWRKGAVLLGQHRGRFFHVIVNALVSDTTWFFPRARLMLEQWRWEDGGPL